MREVELAVQTEPRRRALRVHFSVRVGVFEVEDDLRAGAGGGARERGRWRAGARARGRARTLLFLLFGPCSCISAASAQVEFAQVTVLLSTILEEKSLMFAPDVTLSRRSSISSHAKGVPTDM